MNPTTTTPSRPNSTAPAHPRDDDRRAAPDERSVADFERALQQRSKLQDKGGRQDQSADTEPPPEAPLPSPPPALPAPFALVLAQAQAQAAPIEAPPPARGLVEPPPAALRADPAPPAASAPEAARAFEVSLREPLGGGVTLHAVAPAAGARWALSIGANGLNPQELRRNLGRLEERLRDKALPHEALELLPYAHSDQPDDQP